MKTSFFNNLILILASLFTANIDAQTDNQATFETYLKTVYDVYENGGYDQLVKYYAPTVAEVDPTGRLTAGMKDLKAAWDEMEKMLDSKPKFEYKLTSWRLLKPDVAIITWDTHDEFSIGGQKIIGDNTASAVLHKEKGQWLIEFDQLTPKVDFQMPDQQADMAAINALGKEAYAAFEARDAARFAAVYTEDVDFVTPYGQHLSGRKAVEQAHVELFKAWTNMPKSQIEVSAPNIRFLTPDLAVCQWGHKESMLMDGKTVNEEATFMDVCQRVDGKWLVAGFSITPVQQMPGMEAAKH